MKNAADFVNSMPPRLWWETYRQAVYGSEPLIPQQEKECSNAFFAGIEAGMKFKEMAAASQQLSEDQRLEAVHLFRRMTRVTGVSQNPTGEN